MGGEHRGERERPSRSRSVCHYGDELALVVHVELETVARFFQKCGEWTTVITIR